MKAKQIFNLVLLGLLTVLMPQMAKAQDAVTLANWTFENEADVTGWFGTSELALAPDECVGDASDYVMTGMSTNRYWQTCSGYNNRVLRIENADPINIADYTDPAQHDVYFEAQFPTKGYENIKVSMAIACGKNTAAPMTVVVSTDGGANWFNAGTYTTAATWWTYDAKTFDLSAKDKEKVLVRVIAANEIATNWNMDYFKVEGTVLEGAQPINAPDATITWPFKSGKDNAVAGEVSVDGALSATSFSLGSKIYFDGTQAPNNCETMSKMRPTDAIGKARDEQAFVKYTIVPKKGITFAPKTLAFNAAKFGTSGGTFDVVIVKGSQTLEVATKQDPARNNLDPFQTSYSWDISSLATDSERMDVYVYIYNLAENKHLGLNNIVITGDLEGTPESVPSYTFSVKLGTPGAGNVSVTPSGAEFDEGTELTVKATENFGYHFASWNDEEANVVTTENPYTFNINKNTVLTAVYTQKNVYALNVNIEGGANDYAIKYAPVGDIREGVHHFEEGTEVILTATDNTILTFTNWEDNTTSKERKVVMDGDKSVTATYSCADFIVGWDLENADPKSNRAADYKAESDNAGNMSLRDAEGATYGWLGNGNGTAYNWVAANKGAYFEFSFSTVGYKNILFLIDVANYSDTDCYQSHKLEYSIDGVNFTTLNTYATTRGMESHKEILPEEAENQAKVYVRLVGENWKGTDTNVAGTQIDNIFVLADAEAANDEIAPVLVSSIPANGSEGASASGSIILTFDEKVLAGTNNGAATLNGETITPTVSAKTVVYPYTGLDYNTAYEFVLPAGAITDRYGNAFEGTTISFITMQRVQPTAKLYDAIVAQDGSGDYTTVQTAIDAAPAGRGTPWLIFIKAGKYNEHVDIPASKPYIHLIGQDRNLVEIVDNRLSGGENAVHVNIGATVVVNSDNCFFEGINFVNSYGRDMNDGPQALALNTIGDRIAFNKVGMISYQDTWITTSDANKRHYVKNSWIEGAVDFIYNSGNVFVEQSIINIVRKSGGYIVAPRHYTNTKWGYVFVNNTITAKGVTGVETQPAELNCKPSEVSVWLGRPWHDFPKTVFINTKMEVTIPAAGWYETMGGLPVLWADYNSVDGDGNPLDLSNRRDTYYYTDANGEKVYGTAKNYLTDEEAAEYTVKNVMSGDDGWQPELLCEACDAPVVSAKGNKLTWEAVPYAICYVITKDGAVVGFTTETSYDGVEGSTYSVQAASEFGGLSEHSAEVTVVKEEEPQPGNTFTLHTIGDSTMEQRDLSTSDKGGWPQMLPQFLTDDVTINNRGKSGASSKSFYQESAYWQTVLKQLKENDFLVVQFAHNDEKNGGADGDKVKEYYRSIGEQAKADAADYRGTTASGTYKEYLRKYVNEAQAKGVKVIFATAICRKYFSGNTIRRNGQHDLGDSFTLCDGTSYSEGNKVPDSDDTYDYSAQMKNVAAEYGLPVVDLTTLTAQMYVDYGEQYCTEFIFCPNDGTHPAPVGATLIARLFAQDVLNQAEKADCHEYIKELAQHIRMSSDISFTPNDGYLGKSYPGQTLSKAFSLSALGIAPATGSLEISADNGFEVSTDGKNFAASQTLDYEGGNVITTITVRTVLNTSGLTEGTLTVTNGNVTKVLALSAECISLEGAVECSVLWPLTKSTQAEPTVNGPINAVAESWSNMYAKDYNAINSKAVWPEESGYDASHQTQRNGIMGDAWPAGEIDEVSDRYIQFGATAPANTQISVDKISLYVAGAGGSGMRCKIYYSLNDDFSNPVCIQEMKSMAGNTAYLVQTIPAVDILPGKSIYLRIYPWYNGAATGKTLALSDVMIHGLATESVADGIDVLTNGQLTNDNCMFNLQGQKVAPTYKGLTIMRSTSGRLQGKNGKKVMRK